MSLRTVFATVLSIGLLAPAAFAQSPTPPASGDQAGRGASIAARQGLQLGRIRAGHERGTITQAERLRLLAMERNIRTLAHRLRGSENRLTGRERLRLHQQLNRASRTIRRAGRGRG